MGYLCVEDIEKADIIVFNTCCIRESAETHAYGNIGALKKLKKAKKSLIVAVGGCMTEQVGAKEKLKVLKGTTDDEITVWFRSGTYLFSEEITFDSSDYSNVTYRSYPNEDVVFSGSI